MSVFDTIQAAIATAATQTGVVQQQTASPQSLDPTSAIPGLGSVGGAGTIVNVNVEEVLTNLAQQKGRPSNWKTSIVDLMTLLDLDHSLSHREQLADELGYTGEKNGSAEMNIFLHRKVMEGLAANGGIVPDSLKG